jgi:hypothetical protein
MRPYVPCLLLALVTALLSPISASSQPPAEESVCDSLSGAAFGLCNAYCEAMDCDSEAPNANETACLKVLSDFTKHSDGLIPCGRVTCPCWDDADVDSLFAACADLPVDCCYDCAMSQNFHGSVMSCTERPRGITHNLAVVTGIGSPLIACGIGAVPTLEDGWYDVTEGEAIACRQVLKDRFSDCDTVWTNP